MKADYEAERIKIFKNRSGEEISVLLHSCCAPCSTACLERLVADGENEKTNLKSAVYYYNPNINEKYEFDRRLNEQKRFLSEVYGEKIPLLYDDYNCDEFYAAVKGLEKCPEGGERCEKCFKLRL